MKYGDIRYLLKNNFKNKRVMRYVIATFCISFLILIPMLWLNFAFYYDCIDKIGECDANNLFAFDYSQDETVLYGGSYGLYDRYNGTNKYKEMSEIAQELQKSFSIQLEYGELILSVDNDVREYRNNRTLKFFDGVPQKSEMVPDYVANYLGHGSVDGLFVGNGFEGDGRGQVVIAEEVAKLYGGKDLIGKNISMSLAIGNTSYPSKLFEEYLPPALDNDSDAENGHRNADVSSYSSVMMNFDEVKIFKDFKIVGIIKDEIFASDVPSMSLSKFWFTQSSVIDNGESYLPKINKQTILDGEMQPYEAAIITYADGDIVSLASRAVENGYVFPFFVTGGYVSPWTQYAPPNNVKSFTPIISSLLLFNDYNGVKMAYNDYSINFYSKLDKNNIRVIAAPISRTTYNAVLVSNDYDKINLMMLLLGISLGIAGIVSYCAMASFNISSRIREIGMMRAVGATKKSIYKLYLTEFFAIFAIAAIISAVISSVVCISISISVGDLGITVADKAIGLNLWYLPLSMAIVYGVYIISGVAFTALKLNKVIRLGVSSQIR